MINRATLFGGIASALLLASPAFATSAVGDPAAGLQAMRELNLIVLGDLGQNGQNVQGKTFVGGNLSGGGQYGVGNSQRSETASDRATLTVVGNVTGNNLNLHNGSNGGNGLVGTPASVVIGGDFTAGMNMNTSNATLAVGGKVQNVNGSNGSKIQSGGGKGGYLNANGASVSTGLGDAFTAPLVAGLTAEQATLEADLKAASLALAGMQTTAGNDTSAYYGRLTLHAANDGSGVSVFNLTDAIFGYNEFALNLANANDPVIINITGDGSYDWNANSINGLNWTVADNIIWNFSDASVLNLNREVFGSVLAPFATVTNANQLSGSIVAGKMNMKGQVQLGTFGGDVHFRDATAGAVPEPATWAMMIAGFGLVGAMMRRRRGNGMRNGSPAVVTQ